MKIKEHRKWFRDMTKALKEAKTLADEYEKKDKIIFEKNKVS